MFTRPSQRPFILLYICTFFLVMVVSSSLSSAPQFVTDFVVGADKLPAYVADKRLLPSDVSGLPEIVTQRTANTATFDLGNGRYTTIASTAPMHYLNDQGAWQVIDPAFRPLADSFVVEHNSLRSRAGLDQAWISVAAGRTAVSWQAQTLGITDDDGNFTPLNHVLAQTDTTATLNEDGRILHYSNGWSDTSLSEEISSAPGSLEHSLILDAPPQAAGTPQYLEMQATLQLLPGATLWAEGEARSAPFVTDGTLEIRDDQGNISQIFDPALAFEQDNRATAVAGEYNVQPGTETGIWTVGVRTPWRWWVDSTRQYPAVIDPVIRVQTSTSTSLGSGMAWVRSNGNQDYTVSEIILGAHVPNWQTKTRGYVQFNSLPALLTNANVQVKSAMLEVTPTAMWFPSYWWKGKGFTDWDSIHIKRDVRLNYVGACPADCNKFSLNDDTVSNDPTNQFNWDNSLEGTQVEPNVNKQLVAGTGNDGLAKKTTTSWDVTSEIQQWYKDWYAGPYPRSFPTFMMEFTKTCGTDYTSDGLYINFDSLQVGNCTWFGMYPGNIQLLIEYEPLPLSPGDNTLLNQPGVPSYLPGVFANNNDYDTNHEYDLNPASGIHWRAIAVRGNHAMEADGNVPTHASLQLWDQTGQPELLASAGSAEPNSTAFVLINDHQFNNLATADLHVEVTPTDQNNFDQDQERNYRLHYVAAETITFTNGKAIYSGIFSSAQLIWLKEFYLVEGDNLTIKVKAPDALEVVLIEPANSNGKDAAVNPIINGNEKFLDVEGVRSLFYPAPRTGYYALALVNTKRPFKCVNPAEDRCKAGEPANYYPTVNLKVCPEGSIAVDKFEQDGVSCQPIRLPNNHKSQPMPIPSGGHLTIYSPGGFDVTDDQTWCSDNEIQGAPIIDAGVNGLWVAVVQGRVCRDGDTLYTTDDSAVGLVVPAKSSPPGSPRGQPWPGFVYGSPTLPVGPEDGVVVMDADGRLLPEDAVGKPTRHNIRPFDDKWLEEYTPGKNEYTPGNPIDYISTADMRAYGGGKVEALVTTDADQHAIPIRWDVNWWLQPTVCTDCVHYIPRFTANQTPAFAMPVSLASLDIRVLHGGADDGLLDLVDVKPAGAGPNVFQFRAKEARVTQAAKMGGATRAIQVVVQSPDERRAPDKVTSCSDGTDSTSCFDVRMANYEYNDGAGEWAANLKPWALPDIHLDGQANTVAFNQTGRLHVFSSDHPAATAVNNLSQSFSFDTWGATVTAVEEPCFPGEPTTTVVTGDGYIYLPMLGDDGSGPPPNTPGSSAVHVEFKLCETNLREAVLTFKAPTPVPVGSTGFGVTLIGGTVTIGPESTQIRLDVRFRSMDGVTLTEGDNLGQNEGNGSVLIDTAGLFSLQAKGVLVGKFDTDFQLDVAWDPLDVLLEGNVSGYGGLITGYLRLHGWVGSGWQNKYPWIHDQDFHFTGTIGAKIRIETGELIDELILQIPPFTISLDAEVSFGEFCANANCTAHKWGVSATVSVFGYGVGVYADSGGPQIFLGSSGKKLIDQFGGSGQAAAGFPSSAFSLAIESLPTTKPGATQPFLTPPLASPLDALKSSPNNCTGKETAVHTCPFTVPTGAGRALFGVSWLNSSLDVALINPNGEIITAANAADHGVTITPSHDKLLHHVALVVNPTGNATSIPGGVWKVRLSNVGKGLLSNTDNQYSLLFVADPPAPTLDVTFPEVADTAVSGTINLTWIAKRGGQSIEPGAQLELFYAPVLQPLTFEPHVVTFPGDYLTLNNLPTIQASDTNNDGVWKVVRSDIPAGNYSFHASVTMPQVGIYGDPGGITPTISLANSNEPVHFYYDASDNFVASRPNDDIVVLVGDMMSEIGGADWTPDNLVGWMKVHSDEQPTMHSVDLTLPAGEWHYKVAINESWAENYGANGKPNGDEITFTVPDGGATVRFRYDSATHALSEEILAVTPGTLIAFQVSAHTGTYQWDTSGLASGTYMIGARLDDREHGNGHVVDWAPGTIVINDKDAPPTPTIVSHVFDQDGGLLVTWKRDTVTPDLAGYQVEYPIPNWDLQTPLPSTQVRRVLPTAPEPASPYEHIRLGGLYLLMQAPGIQNAFVTSVCVRAYDASGNLSDCTLFEVPMEEEVGDPRVGPPEELIVTVEGGNMFHLNWLPPVEGGQAGYLLSYQLDRCLTPDASNLADEGPSPIQLSASETEFQLNGLTIGQWYRFTLRAYGANGLAGTAVSASAILLEPYDGNGDGVPDEWMAIYGLTDPLGDADEDMLINRREYVVGANPLHADSDDDGYYDGEEGLTWGTAVCGSERPPYHALPRMVLFGQAELSFKAAANDTAVASQRIDITNVGSGDLNWRAFASTAWITPDPTTGQNTSHLDIGVNLNGLAPGIYEGVVTITHPSDGGTLVIPETAVIPVRLTVLPDKMFELYLPVTLVGQ